MMTFYNVKYKLHFHTFNKIVEDKIKISDGTAFFFEGRNRTVYNEKDAIDYVKATHKNGEIEKLFIVPEEVYSSEYGEIGATSLTILSCWLG